MLEDRVRIIKLLNYRADLRQKPLRKWFGTHVGTVCNTIVQTG